MMPVLIQIPKQLGNDIDVYLRPLVEELLLLWNSTGVHVWDEYKQEHFDLRALLFIIINVWPALSNLSRQSNKGYNARTHCFDDMESIFLKKCQKVIYMGHRRFLPLNHALRKRDKNFKGKAKHRTKPDNHSGEDVFNMVKTYMYSLERDLAANLFRMMLTDTHPCGRRSQYFGPTCKS
jgi:hypothetical protein